MRKLLCFAGAFSLAVFAGHYTPWLLLLALPVLFLRGDRRLRCALVCAGLLAGALWPRAYHALFLSRAQAMEGQTLPVTATVTDWPWATRAGGGVTVRLETGGHPVLARLYAGSEALDLRPGDRISAQAQCRSAGIYRGQENDSLPAKGIRLVLYANDGVTWTRPERPPVSVWPAYALQWLKDRTDACFPSREAALLRALLTGDKSALPEGDYAALRRVGLAHAVAVSGMHLTFLVSLVGFCLGQYRRRTAVISLVLMWWFALMVGMGPSVVRAAVMQTLLLLAPLAGRENDPPTSLSLALMLILLQNPDAAGSVGLQLSFAAVAGILAFSGRMFRWSWEKVPRGWPKPARRLLRFLLSTLAVTLGALAFTTPLSAWYFGMVSLVAPLAGVLCLWAVSLAFSGGLAAAVTGLAPLAALVTLLLRYLWWMAFRLADLPFAAVSTQCGYLAAALIFVYLILLLFLVQKGPRRPLVPLCACLTVLTAALWLTALDYRLGPMTFTLLDVGQGQSAVLRAGERVMVVDCGGNGSNAGDLCADYLQTRGQSRVDLLVLTHFHEDHANGVPELLARMPVDNLAVPEPEPDDLLAREILNLAQAQGTRITYISQDQRTDFGGAQLTLYAPLGAGEANESGLSVLCQGEAFSALLTGDMDQVVEGRLVKYGGLPQVELLVGGHHGAKSSTSQTLLEAVEPHVVAFSTGYNTYGHPNPETLARVEAMGCAVYRTDRQGNITITVG